jgi:FMN reductase
MNVTVVVGNPKLNSKTRHAAEKLARLLTGAEPDTVIEVAALGPGVLGWGDPGVKDAVNTVMTSDLVVVASPTFKATYSGLLKTFLDQFEGSVGMRDIVVVPLMLGGAPTHALAAELTLKPVLAELGAITALPGLYLIDSSFNEDGALERYAERWSSTVSKLTA